MVDGRGSLSNASISAANKDRFLKSEATIALQWALQSLSKRALIAKLEIQICHKVYWLNTLTTNEAEETTTVRNVGIFRVVPKSEATFIWLFVMRERDTALLLLHCNDATPHSTFA